MDVVDLVKKMPKPNLVLRTFLVITLSLSLLNGHTIRQDLKETATSRSLSINWTQTEWLDSTF